MVRVRSYSRSLPHKLPNRWILIELFVVVTVLALIIVGPGLIQFSTIGARPLLRVWAFSDTHFDDSFTTYDWSSNLSQRLDNMRGNYDLGFVLGDVVMWKNDLVEMTAFYNLLKNKSLDSNFFVITGNHETIHGSSGASTVDPYYLANVSPTQTHNFIKRVGNILFIFIGDEGCYGSGGSYGLCGRSTYEWFDSVVVANQDKIIVVNSHEHLNFVLDWNESLPLSEDFKRTLTNYNVDLWIYGHTHILGIKEIVFPTGKRTLFVNDGAWECSSRGCYIGSRDSVLLTFTENSNVVKIDRVRYSNPDDTTPEIIGLSSYPFLDFPFCNSEDCYKVNCSANSDCTLYAGTRLCDVAKGKCVECTQNSDCAPYTCLNGSCTKCGNAVCEKAKGETVGNCPVDCEYACGDTVTENYILKKDLSCNIAGANALIVGAENVTIDCKGHTITGSGTEWRDAGTGIGIKAAKNTIVKNCKITNFRVATSGFANGYSVEDSEIYGNEMGIATIAYGTTWKFLRNNIHDNNWAIIIDESLNVEIGNNLIHHNKRAVSPGIALVYSNAPNALTLWPQDLGNIHDNTIEYNDSVGIDFYESYSQVKNNIIRYNKSGLEYTIARVLYRALVSPACPYGNCPIPGWELYGVKRSNHNIISGNQIYGNTEYDFKIFWNVPMFGYNVGISFADFENTIENNVVNGKQFYYYFQKNNLTLSGLDADKIYCIQCKNMSISNSTIRDLYLLDTNDSTFSNIAFSGGEQGINLYSSHRNTFSNYTITDTKNTIKLVEYPAGDTNAGLVSYYKFDEGSGNTIADQSRNNPGTNAGGEWKGDCKSGSCLNFTGDQYVKTGVSDSLNMSGGNFTITAWVKFNSMQEGYRAIYNYHPTNGWYTLYKSDTQKLHVRAGNNYLEGSTPLQTGQWYFVVGSYGDGKYTVYVNGKLDGQKIAIPTAWEGGLPVSAFIGKGSITGTDGIDATIDDVRIYDRVLNADEIRFLFNPFDNTFSNGSNCIDNDSDGVCDDLDNCQIYNPDQKDFDGDGIGDVCDVDLCGNRKVDIGENCANCPQDVKCYVGGALCCGTACIRPCTSNVFCGDYEVATKDLCNLPGTCEAVCTHTLITECTNDDDYCPIGCFENTDNDCLETCGNSIVDTEENCGNCPQDISCSPEKICCNTECLTPACLEDSDCDDSNPNTKDTCQGKCSAAKCDNSEIPFPPPPPVDYTFLYLTAIGIISVVGIYYFKVTRKKRRR